MLRWRLLNEMVGTRSRQSMSTISRSGLMRYKAFTSDLRVVAPQRLRSITTSRPMLEKVDAKDDTSQQKNQVAKLDYDDYDDYEEPKTAGQKISFYTVLFFRLSLLAAGVVCIFFTGRELFPGRMGPQSLFSEAFETLQIRDEIRLIVGENMKAYGRDTGRHAEGRRNHVDSRKYKEADGSNRTRIRFNIKGPKGKLRVWAEVSDRMPSTEFVYLICQDMRTGRVITIHDNRSRLEAEMSAGDSQEGKNAIQALLGSFGKAASGSK